MNPSSRGTEEANEARVLTETASQDVRPSNLGSFNGEKPLEESRWGGLMPFWVGFVPGIPKDLCYMIIYNDYIYVYNYIHVGFSRIFQIRIMRRRLVCIES